MHISKQHTRSLRWLVCTTLILGFCNLQLRADRKTLKSDLEGALVGQSVISRITFGGKAIPPGARADYPVNTVVYPDSGQVAFRVEWGLMRVDVSPAQMQRRFDRGTSFRVTGIEIKDDRLELKLQSGSGDSARLKLMLGAGWQSKFDLQSVQSQLSRIFVLDQVHQPQQQTVNTTPVSNATPSAFLSTTSATQYQHDPNAPKREGRISDGDLRTVMAEFDEDMRHVFSTLSQDSSALSQGLLTFQQAYSGRSDYASRPLLQDILRLQDRLGKNMQPQSDDDVIAINEVFKRCVRISQLGQARDEQGNLYGAGRNSASFQPMLLSNSAAEVSSNVQRDVAVERQQRQPIERARTAVINVEQALDRGDLIAASQNYQQMVSDSQTVQVSALQHYLQLTVAFRQDIASYEQGSRLAHHRDLSASEEIKFLAQEVNALNASQTKPLTRGLLQSTVNAEAAVARQKLDGLPLLQIDETAYRLPQARDAGSSNLNDNLSLVTSRISDVDGKLRSATELRQIAALVDALTTVAAVLGPNETMSLKQKIDQIATAERIRASLVQTQQALQSRIVEVRAEEQRREAAARAEEQRRAEAARAEAAAKLAAAAAERQSYAEELTKSMAGEIRWCATGQGNEVLAGVVAASRLSDNTYSQLGAGSPLWKQMFSKGFRFRAIQDRNRSLKVAAIKAEGGFSVSMTTLPDVDRTSLEQAISTLSVGASDGHGTP
jgi:hypothetical protein